MLELRHVGFETDDNKEILRDVSLTVQDRFVAITGPNGGGKSTLAKVIAGILTPTQGRILLGKRADTGQWALVYGIVEPAEEPADTCVREALEETGVDIEPVSLVSVKSSPYMVTYANGDQCQYMDLLFFCRPREGGNAQPRVADDESLEVGWFAPDALPQPLATSTQSRLELVQRFKQNAAQGNPACLFTSNLV